MGAKSYIWLCFILWAIPGPAQSLVTLQRSENIMGAAVTVTLVADSEDLGYIQLEEALASFRRIEAMTSATQPDSGIARINRMAGRAPVEVSPELFGLIRRAIQISRMTDGAFDITYAALDTLWRYDGGMKQIPGPEAIEKVMPLVGYRHIRLDPENRTVFLPRKGMRIDLSGIAAGYAAEHVRDLLRHKQVPGGMVRAGGLIAVWGQKATGEQWLLGISDPNKLGKMLAWVPLVESAACILRSDRRFVEYNGLRYGEVLDPASGRPATGVAQVTVFTSSAELCQALGVALTVMGPEAGLPMVEVLGDTEAVMVDDSGFLYWTSGLLIHQD